MFSGSSAGCVTAISRLNDSLCHSAKGCDHVMRNLRNWLQRSIVGTGLVIILAALGALMAAPAQAANSVINGGFERPVVTPNTFQTFSAGQSFGSWTVTKGTVDLIGASFWEAAGGVQSLDLNGRQPGAVAQTFDTAPGVLYRVTFALAGNPGTPGNPSIPAVKTGRALINGQVAQDFFFDVTGKTMTNMGYVTKTFTFLATSPSTTLEFSSTTSPGGAWGPVIDKVRVEETCKPGCC